MEEKENSFCKRCCTKKISTFQKKCNMTGSNWDVFEFFCQIVFINNKNEENAEHLRMYTTMHVIMLHVDCSVALKFPIFILMVKFFAL